MGSLVAEYGEFTARKGNFINTDVSTDILFKKQLILCMGKLIPVKITTNDCGITASEEHRQRYQYNSFIKKTQNKYCAIRIPSATIRQLRLMY